jgi:hypothetical protein
VRVMVLVRGGPGGAEAWGDGVMGLVRGNEGSSE